MDIHQRLSRIAGPLGKGLRLFATKSGSGFAAIIGTLSVIALLLAWWLPNPQLYASIDAVSELIRYRVARPVVATMVLQDAMVRSGRIAADCPSLDDATPVFFTGLVQPSLGAIVTYRASDKGVAIQIESGPPAEKGDSPGIAATLQFADRADCDIRDSLTITIPRGRLGLERDGGDGGMSGIPQPLPLAGPADIGQEFGLPAMPRQGASRIYNIMWEGNIKVFARSSLSGKLYPLRDSEFPLPAGGRLSAGDSLNRLEPFDPAIPAWHGTATPSERGFQVSATTVSGDIKLYRPGTRQDEAETFGLGLFADILSDPDLAFLSLTVAVISFVMGALSGWMALWRDPES